MSRGNAVSEKRFVVDVCEPVPDGRVIEISSRVAARLRMDTPRVRTLLQGRTGPVTRPVPWEKADVIARAFAEAGAAVEVREATPAELEPAAPDAQGADLHGDTHGDAHGDADVEPHDADAARGDPDAAAEPPPAHEPERGDAPLVAGEADAGGGWEPHPWEGDGFGFEGSDPWWDGSEPAASGRSGAEPEPVGDEPAPDRRTATHAGGARAEEPSPAEELSPAEAEPVPLGPTHDAGDAADVAAPPTPDGDPRPAEGGRIGGAGGTGRTPARPDTPDTMFLSSTRWVPSPHDEVDTVLEGEAERGPGSVRSRAAPSPRQGGRGVAGRAAQGAGKGSSSGPVPPRERGPGLRGYLLLGLVLSLALLLALQGLNAARGPAAGSATVEQGMRAYQAGEFDRARRVWTPLADGGNPTAQYMLGYMAEAGQGRPWSNHDAAAWYRLAAAQGQTDAQVRLGDLYLRGMGVDRDPSEAARLFGEAARAGDAEAAYRYGLAWFQGVGVPQDFDAALRWFRVAAAGGVAEAEPYVTFAERAGGAGAAPAPAAPAGTPGAP